MISNEWEFSNRYSAGEEAMDRSNWRLAFDCFNDCLEYAKRYLYWDEEQIENLEKLVKYCNSMFR